MLQERINQYLTDRVEHQLRYFEAKAGKCQRNYRILKSTAIICNVLTTFAISLAFTVPEDQKVPMGIIALILSTIVLATYQWEEFHSYGAQWEKFRLVAEQIKGERWYFLYSAGSYKSMDEGTSFELFVSRIESIIRGTDLSYFAIMVEPGKRIEKRLQNREVE